jgi:hypothetical protein
MGKLIKINYEIIKISCIVMLIMCVYYRLRGYAKCINFFCSYILTVVLKVVNLMALLYPLKFYESTG